MYKMNRSLMI